MFNPLRAHNDQEMTPLQRQADAIRVQLRELPGLKVKTDLGSVSVSQRPKSTVNIKAKIAKDVCVELIRVYRVVPYADAFTSVVGHSCQIRGKTDRMSFVRHAVLESADG